MCFAHATGTECCGDLVGAEFLADGERRRRNL
jgi:hypothetical protein